MVWVVVDVITKPTPRLTAPVRNGGPRPRVNPCRFMASRSASTATAFRPSGLQIIYRKMFFIEYLFIYVFPYCYFLPLAPLLSRNDNDRPTRTKPRSILGAVIVTSVMHGLDSDCSVQFLLQSLVHPSMHKEDKSQIICRVGPCKLGEKGKRHPFL